MVDRFNRSPGEIPLLLSVEVSAGRFSQPDDFAYFDGLDAGILVLSERLLTRIERSIAQLGRAIAAGGTGERGNFARLRSFSGAELQVLASFSELYEHLGRDELMRATLPPNGSMLVGRLGFPYTHELLVEISIERFVLLQGSLRAKLITTLKVTGNWAWVAIGATVTTLSTTHVVNQKWDHHDSVEIIEATVKQDPCITRATCSIDPEALLQATGQSLSWHVPGLTPQERANRIAMVQTALRVQGVWAGPIDGIDGPQLDAALKAFQHEHKLAGMHPYDPGVLFKVLFEMKHHLPGQSHGHD